MGDKSKFLIAIFSVVMITSSALAHSHHTGNPAHAKGKRHYWLHHDHYHINDPKHPRSPKWHPTNPHSGNFAD
jgi:hypothetical protein